MNVERQYLTLCAGVQLYTVQANRYYLHKIIIIILSYTSYEEIGQFVKRKLDRSLIFVLLNTRK